MSLSSKEAANALAIREQLESFRRDTGRSVNALEAVSGYLELLKVLPAAISPEQAVREFSSTVATVHKQSLAKAVEEFNAGRLAKTVTKDGKRPELSPLYVSNTSMWLREFSNMLPGHLITDINKAHFAVYVEALKNHSAKARNDRRAILKSFLTWCAKQDYLPQSHRLFESVGLEREKVAETVTTTYSPEQLVTLT